MKTCSSTRRPRIDAGTLVEMPFENLSNGTALWVDVVWSKERPLGLGARRFVDLMSHDAHRAGHPAEQVCSTTPASEHA